MLYYSEKSRSYRFPGHESVLNYEKDHHLYCPSSDNFTYLENDPYDSYGPLSIPSVSTYTENTSYTTPFF